MVWTVALLSQRVNPAIVSNSVKIFWICKQKNIFSVHVDDVDDFEGAFESDIIEPPAVVSAEREESASAVGKITHCTLVHV